VARLVKAPAEAKAEKERSDAAQTRQSPRTGAAIDSIRPQKPTTRNGIIPTKDDGQFWGSLQPTGGLFPSWEKQPDSDHDQKNDDGVHERLQSRGKCLFGRGGPFRRRDSEMVRGRDDARGA